MHTLMYCYMYVVHPPLLHFSLDLDGEAFLCLTNDCFKYVGNSVKRTGQTLFVLFCMTVACAKISIAGS